MKTVIAVDAMGGDHGPKVTVPACIDFLATDPDAELLLVGLKERARARARAPSRRGLAAHPIVARDRSGRHGRGRAHRHPHQEAFLDAHGHRPGEGRPRAGLRERGQHRRPHGHGEVRPEDASRHRPSRDLRRAAHAHGPGLRARPRRQRRLHARAPAAVRHHGLDAREGGRGQGQSDRGPAQHRLRGDQGQRRGEEGGRAAARERRSTSTATSRATTSTRARPTWWCATASRATWRSRPPRASRRCWATSSRRSTRATVFSRIAAVDLLSRHQALPPPRRPPPLQRRGAPRPARHRGEEPRLGRPPRVRHRACSAPPPKRATA